VRRVRHPPRLNPTAAGDVNHDATRIGHTCAVPAEPAVFTIAFAPDAVPRLPVRRLANVLVFRRRPDGRVTVDAFPDEADVCAAAVVALDPALVRLERGRLYITAANGQAIYVPVGPSPIPDCVRFGRLYLRLAE
jgi:hypothetical protein